MTLSPVDVWAAFRALRTDGADVYASLRRHLPESGFLKRPGDTLELGAGDGFLWRGEGAPLLRSACSRGSVLLTDVDPAVEQCRNLGGVAVERADAGRLPYQAERFARVLAVQVLHWCELPAAVNELARVLDTEGCAVVVTVDERVHLTEVYALMREAKGRLQARGVPFDVVLPAVPPRISRFCASNAEELLSGAFASVRRIDFDYAHLFEARHPSLPVGGGELLSLYVGSAPFLRETQLEPGRLDAFIAEVKVLAEEAIAARGAFRASRRDVLYECSSRRRST